MRTIAIINQKGGCGKTTTAINLAAIYARRGLRTLVVDMDPQAHCAAGLGVPESRIEYSIGEALLAQHSTGFDPAPLIWEVSRNLHLAPSTMMLAALEAPDGGLHKLPDKDRRLESLLSAIAGRFDRCLIDCPPTVGLLTFNALRAAREALIPVETGFFALRGAEKQWNTIQRMINHIGRPIACHLLATLHKPGSKLAQNILSALRRQFAGQIVPVVIHEHEMLREAASFGQPVIEYAPASDAARDFESLTEWLEDHAAHSGVEIEVLTSGPPGAQAGHSGTHVEVPVASAAHSGGGSNRAAELARRVHKLAAIAAAREIAAELATLPAVATEPMPTDIAAAEISNPRGEPLPPAAVLSMMHAERAAVRTSNTQIEHIFGVRQTSAGVLFVQPAGGVQSVAIAGEFNHWSPRASPMKLNPELSVFQAIIPLPPGRHQYRVVVDDQWITDPYNSEQAMNCYGEPNSVAVVS